MNNLDMQMQNVQNTGIRLNKYILTEEIGRGGHGIVYRAYHEENVSEAVAVKIVEDSGNLDSLLIEPELLSRLNHPNIIRLKDFFIHAGKLVLVTEYIDGTDLQTYLNNRGKLTNSEVKTFLSQMADALAHAHTNNIIHRDIKLSNILVTSNAQSPRFVLVDFGISRMAEGIQTVKRVAGTYYYMAPEQLRGRPCEQSDLWSLGVCAYTLLTGIKPFEGDTEENLSKRILLSIPQFPSDILETIDPGLENIIFHLLEKELINRPVSAKNLLNELEQIFQENIQKDSSQTNNLVTSRNTWEQKIISEEKKSWFRFCTFVFLATLPDGIIGDAISISGLFLFYLGQQKLNFIRTVAGIFLLLLGLLISSIINEAFAVSQSSSLFTIQSLISIPFTLAAVHYLTKTNRLKEDLFFYKTLREASRDSKKIIDLLKIYVDVNWGNLNLRQKYIELLFLNQRFEEAIIEAKLALDIDPYNFGATLLLANGYFEVGLYEECMQVCNNYLSLSNYSFEFSDLKNKCQVILTAS